MGKSNRIRNNRANAKLTENYGIKTKEKKGMPSWAMSLIAILITLAVVLSVAFSLLSANGVILRMQTAASSENFKVNGNMMSYFFNLEYQAFQEEHANYLSNYSLDTSKPLDDQQFGVAKTEGGMAYETSFIGTEFVGKTWYDYILSRTKETVKDTLRYCEEAVALGIELDENDETYIQQSLDSFDQMASIYGYGSASSYLSTTYGKGVSKGDVKKAMELSLLADKCISHLNDKLMNAITEDQVVGEYEENSSKYDIVDYLSYTFTVKYTDVAKEVIGKDNYDATELAEKKDDVLKAYAEKIAATKELAAALKGKVSIEEFEKYATEKIVEINYDKYVKSAAFATADDKPSDDKAKALRDAIIQKIVEDVLANKEKTTIAKENSTETSFDICGVTLTIEGANVYMTSIIENTHKASLASKKALLTEKVTFSDDKDDEAESLSDWAFADDRKALDTKVVETGDGADNAEVKADKQSFNSTVYMLKTTAHKDTEKSKNFAYAIYSSKDDAEAAIKELLAMDDLSLEDFESFMENEDATGFNGNDKIENYSKGGLGISEIDAWLFDDARKLGDVSAEVVSFSTDSSSTASSYAVLFYYDDGDELWYNSAKSVVFANSVNEYYVTMTNTYTIEVNDKVAAKAKQANV